MGGVLPMANGVPMSSSVRRVRKALSRTELMEETDYSPQRHGEHRVGERIFIAETVRTQREEADYSPQRHRGHRDLDIWPRKREIGRGLEIHHERLRVHKSEYFRFEFSVICVYSVVNEAFRG